MKKYFIIVLSALFLLSFFGCSGKKEVDMDKLADELLNGNVFAEKLEPLDLEILGYLYDISEDDYDEALVYCSSGATSDELAIFKAKDENAANKIAQAVQKRIDDQISAFTNYVPAAVPKLENAYTKTNGNYVILCVSTDSDAAKEILDKYLK